MSEPADTIKPSLHIEGTALLYGKYLFAAHRIQKDIETDAHVHNQRI